MLLCHFCRKDSKRLCCVVCCRHGAKVNECTTEDKWNARLVELLKKVAQEDPDLHLSLFKELHLTAEKKVSSAKLFKQAMSIGPRLIRLVANELAASRPF